MGHLHQNLDLMLAREEDKMEPKISKIREGDIRSIRNRAELEGRPIKSTTIREGDRTTHYDVRSGRIRIIEVNHEG